MTLSKPEPGAPVVTIYAGATDEGAFNEAMQGFQVVFSDDGGNTYRPGLGVDLFGPFERMLERPIFDQNGAKIQDAIMANYPTWTVALTPSWIGQMSADGDELSTTPADLTNYIDANGTLQTIDGGQALRIGDVWMFVTRPKGAFRVFGETTE